ncbi:MAG: hypothetical protein GXP41_12550 [Chloroflexi bacterium]|nr:hypothetical protein [Chloroflexota bacterium]
MSNPLRQADFRIGPIGCWTVGGIWVLTALMAIALIGDSPYLGLLVAGLGGVAVALASYLNFQQTATKQVGIANKEANSGQTPLPESPATKGAPLGQVSAEDEWSPAPLRNSGPNAPDHED